MFRPGSRMCTAMLAGMLTLAACATSQSPAPDVWVDPPPSILQGIIEAPIDDGGTGLIGPGTGAALGSIIGAGGGAKAAILTGLAIGYALGGSNGPTLTGQSRSAYLAAMRDVLSVPLGTPLRWRYPGDKASGTITPLHEFTDDDGRRCRDFDDTRIVRGSHGLFTGIACVPM